MCMDDARTLGGDDLPQTLLQTADDAELFEHRQTANRPTPVWCPMKRKPVHLLLELFDLTLLGAGELNGLPAHGLLLGDDGESSECVPALQWNRVIQHMKHTQRPPNHSPVYQHTPRYCPLIRCRFDKPTRSRTSWSPRPRSYTASMASLSLKPTTTT